jgi:phage terminase large subunit-like protein
MMAGRKPARKLTRRPAAKPRRVQLHRVDRYAADVRDGRIVAGPLVRAACARHERDQAAGVWTFDRGLADKWISFFEMTLKLPDVTDPDGGVVPFLLQPWQAFIIGSLFGWVGPSGMRRYQDAYIEIGKGNGKTPIAAGIGLGAMVIDGELAAEVYAAATTQDQARLCWRDAEAMAALSPDLCDIQRAAGNLTYPPLRAFFRPVSAEHRGLDGKRPHVGLIDELHEHPNPQVSTKIRAGRKGRKQPLFVEITNSGYDMASVCWQHREKSRKVLEQVVSDDRWFAYVCGLDEGDDPMVDPSCWIKANPNLGVSIQNEYLETQVRTARDIPSESNTVLRLNFCVWTRAQARFIPSSQWAACRVPAPMTDEELRGLPCYAGLDLGETDDFSALALIWILPDGRWYTRGRCWVPRAATESKPDRPYGVWTGERTLTITDGNQADFDLIEADTLEACRAWGVRELAYDKRFAGHLAQHLEAAGVVCVDTPQGYGLNAGLREVSRRVKSQLLAHDGRELFAWHVDNAATRTGREKQIRLDKDSPGDKMDLVAALVMAGCRALVHAEAAAWSGEIVTL